MPNAPTHQICTFTFKNATILHAAVPAFNENGDWLSYDAVFASAKRISWRSDEEAGRGGLQSFHIGEWIHLP